MGRAPDSGRTAAAGLRRGGIHRGQVQGAALAATVADLAFRSSPNTRQLSGLGRFLRRAHGDVPAAVWFLLVLRATGGSSLHFNVTAHPTANWVARQIKEAFPYDEAPRYLIRDRDGAYGECFRECLKHMGVEEVLTAPRSPWQKDYASSCTSFVPSGRTWENRRGSERLIP